MQQKIVSFETIIFDRKFYTPLLHLLAKLISYSYYESPAFFCISETSSFLMLWLLWMPPL